MKQFFLDGHRFDLGSNIVAYMVTGVTNQYSTTEMLDEVSEWCECVTSHVFPFFFPPKHKFQWDL